MLVNIECSWHLFTRTTLELQGRGWFILIYFSSIAKQVLLEFILITLESASWNQPVLSNVGKCSCSRKKRFRGCDSLARGSRNDIKEQFSALSLIVRHV